MKWFGSLNAACISLMQSEVGQTFHGVSPSADVSVSSKSGSPHSTVPDGSAVTLRPRHSKFGRRVFSVAFNSWSWNSLRDQTRSIDNFRLSLKTYLVAVQYNIRLLGLDRTQAQLVCNGTHSRRIICRVLCCRPTHITATTAPTNTVLLGYYSCTERWLACSSFSIVTAASMSLHMILSRSHALYAADSRHTSIDNQYIS